LPTGRTLVITGATGFLGRHLLAIAPPGWPGPVHAITRRHAPDFPQAVTQIHGDLHDPAFLVRAIPEGSAVVNLAYDDKAGADRNVTLATHLAETCARMRVERLVHVSTAVVVGRCADRVVTEATEPRPVTEYQKTKLAIEQHLARLAEGRFPLVTLRPTAVFGTGGENLVKLTHNLRHGPTWANYLRSSVSGRRAMNLVPVETVVAAIDFALRSPRALDDRLYIVSADDAPGNNFRDVERTLQLGLEVPDYALPRLKVPAACLTLALWATGRLSLHPDVRFSSRRLTQAGFVRPVAFEHALDRYAQQVHGELVRA
jgi:nucleoside-diphosphate-sugar epimerase